jgi:hypothetical protein
LRTASLITLKGIGMENYRLLRSVGVKDISQLAQQNPSDLYLTLRDMNRRQHISHRHFTPAVVRLWVREAKRSAK